MRSRLIEIAVEDGQVVLGTLAAPATTMPGVLFVHGWGGSQERDLERAREIAALGCTCLTFDMRGHARTAGQRGTVTREHNLRDVLAAYDALVAQEGVDTSAIAVVGSSYGGYLASLLTAMRPVRWLALRVPALYRDGEWERPKRALDRKDIAQYRSAPVAAEGNRALSAAAAFTGDVLLVESEHDHLIPHTALASWIASFRCARSLTYRVVGGADHALSSAAHRRDYGCLLLRWVTEMVLGAR
jgi:hypothetical protein